MVTLAAQALACTFGLAPQLATCADPVLRVLSFLLTWFGSFVAAVHMPVCSEASHPCGPLCCCSAGVHTYIQVFPFVLASDCLWHASICVCPCTVDRCISLGQEGVGVLSNAALPPQGSAAGRTAQPAPVGTVAAVQACCVVGMSWDAGVLGVVCFPGFRGTNGV